jgi:hypothetical protein
VERKVTEETTVKAACAPASPLYKYVNIDGLRRILGGTVRFTQPSAFNDPFELLPEIITPIDAEERQIPLSFDIGSGRQSVPVDALEPIPEGCGCSDAMSRDIVQQLNSQIGILSLSRVRDSLLMWSHYADQYSGAVLEFDSSHEFFAGQIDIEYRSTRPRRHVDTYLAGTPVSVAELCAKSKQWEYEQEVRVIRRLAECQESGRDKRGFPIFVRPVPLEAIKTVILGERTSVIEQRDIFARIMETPISLSLAAVDHQGFAFREERIKFSVPISKMNPMMSPRTAHIFAELPGQLGEFARWMVHHHPMSKIVNRPT